MATACRDYELLDLTNWHSFILLMMDDRQKDLVLDHEVRLLYMKAAKQLSVVRFSLGSGYEYQEANFFIYKNYLMGSSRRLTASQPLQHIIRAIQNLGKPQIALLSDIPNTTIDFPVNVSLPLEEGDQAFHYGHFLRDCMGTLLRIYQNDCIDEIRDVRNALYFGPSQVSFHTGLINYFLPGFNKFFSPKPESWMKYGNWKVCQFTLRRANIILPSRNTGLMTVKRCPIFNSAIERYNARKYAINTTQKIMLRGALITRRFIRGRSKRWLNDLELCLDRLICNSSNTIECTIDLVDPCNTMETLTRASKLRPYDFVLGSASSALYPSLILNSGQPHILVTSYYSPTTVHISTIRDFAAFGDQISFISPTHSLDQDPSGLHSDWQKEFVLEADEFDKQLCAILARKFCLLK